MHIMHMKRKRLSLQDKKELVEKFIKERIENYKICIKSKGDDIKEVSTKKFCERNGIANNAMLNKWLLMNRLGHLDAWGGKNDLSKINYKDKDVGVLRLINEGLQNPAGEYMRIGFSKINQPDKRKLGNHDMYGAFAMCDIEKDTIIGYYQGMVCGLNDSYSSYKQEINKTSVIDAVDFLSCHARYINDGGVPENANVDFQLDHRKSCPMQEKLKLVTLKSIKIDEELFCDYGIEYWVGQMHAMSNHDKRKKICKELVNMKEPSVEEDLIVDE